MTKSFFIIAAGDPGSCVIAVAAVAVALFAALISYFQWRIASNKLRLDLFEKRLRVYQAAIHFLQAAVNAQGFQDDAIVEFNVGTADAHFLFQSDVTDRLEEIRRRACGLGHYKLQYDRLPIGFHRTSIIEKEASEREWLSGQILSLRCVFLAYLDFQNTEPLWFLR